MTIFILKQVLKNWYRITSYNPNALLYDSLLCNKTMQINKNKTNWWLNINHMSNEVLKLDLTEIPNPNRLNFILNEATRLMESTFLGKWHQELNRINNNMKQHGGNKLRTYNCFKQAFEYESYLDFETNFYLRSNITKLRISSHKLEIELGRYTNSNGLNPPQNRICKQCNLETEDEEHIILRCPMYTSVRNKYLLKMHEIFPLFNHLNERDKFLFTMSCQDYEITSILSKLLDEIKKIRASL